MYQIKKRFNFSAAHRLRYHKGKCKSLHGHNYECIITLEAPRLNDNGFVIDFAEVKELVVMVVMDQMDHGCFVSSRDTELLQFLIYEEQKQFQMATETTAENVARVIHNIADSAITEKFGMSCPIQVTQVELFETDSCCAIYKEA